MGRKGVPGVAVGILHDGQVTAEGFGVTNVEHPLPVTDTTLFEIGSITKTFVGTAVMRLVEQGKLDLKATVRSYIPELRVADEAAAAGVTLFHLLTHTSGWSGDLFLDTGLGDDCLARYILLMTGLPQEAPLGMHWSYNNAGFSVAGRILELVTGQSFPALMQDLVLGPLGLRHTFLEPTDVMTHRFVVGHQRGEWGPEVSRPWPVERSGLPQGGVVTDVRDLLHYARFHLGDGRTADGNRLLEASTLAQMQTPQVPVWGKRSWGLSWGLEEVDGVRVVRHSGGTHGQISWLALVPERQFALAVVTNADEGGAVTDEVHRWALREYLGLEVRRPAAISAKPEDLAVYAGRYRGFYSDLELGMLGGSLVSQVTYKRGFPNERIPPLPSPPPMTLGLCGPDELLVLDGDEQGDTMEAIRTAEGAIGWLRSSGRLHTRGA